MIVLLIAVTLFGLLINYLLSNRDYMHPSVVFHLVFFVYEVVCLCGTSEYAISLHIKTVVVLLIGFMAITCAHIWSKRCSINNNRFEFRLLEIRIPKLYLRTLVFLQLVSIVFFFIYLKRLAEAYGQLYGTTPDTIGEMIKLYDTLTKFWGEIFTKLAVPIPMAYRITNPICAGAEYIVLYVMVNNYLLKKTKINTWEILILILMCTRIVMNGSRSPLLRIFTFVFVLVYILNYRRGRIRRGDLRFLGKLILAAAGFGVAMFLVLILMGRMASFTGIGDHLFVYLGAPIVNLDTVIETNSLKLFGPIDISAPLGAQTFKNLYNYAGKIFNIEQFRSIKSVGRFMFSNNGKEIGNVFTMFYPILYDFGFVCVFPFSFIIGIFYCKTYKKVLHRSNSNKIDFRLMIYAYLFNDLVMSAFSNRFYATIFDAPFIKFIIVAWILDFFLLQRRIVLFKKVYPIERCGVFQYDGIRSL